MLRSLTRSKLTSASFIGRQSFRQPLPFDLSTYSVGNRQKNLEKLEDDPQSQMTRDDNDHDHDHDAGHVCGG